MAFRPSTQRGEKNISDRGPVGGVIDVGGVVAQGWACALEHAASTYRTLTSLTQRDGSRRSRKAPRDVTHKADRAPDFT